MRPNLLSQAIALLTACGLVLVVLTACTLLLEIGHQTVAATASMGAPRPTLQHTARPVAALHHSSRAL